MIDDENVEIYIIEYLNIINLSNFSSHELGLHQEKPTVPKLRSGPDRRGRESEGDGSTDVSTEGPEATRTKAMETSESV